jgi:hypothetical protein|nr:hypothetical protein [uncultured Acetatifactor sp.]
MLEKIGNKPIRNKYFILLLTILLLIPSAGCASNIENTDKNITTEDTSIAISGNLEISDATEASTADIAPLAETKEADVDIVSEYGTIDIYEDMISPSVSANSELSEIENTQLDKITDFGDNQIEDSFEDNTDSLTSTQRNSINMLNYITVLTQEINESKGSRLYLESAYNFLINYIYPNAVDTRTQAQITSILDTLEEYRMIAVKRERLEYIYEQNRAQALRKAIPNPIGLLSVVESHNLLKMAASVIYMAVDSALSYSSEAFQADLRYLQNGWELDDAESAELHNSRKSAFSYMLNMIRDNSIPGDYALNEESVQNFVEWKNNTNPARKIAWLETSQETYKEFGPYWLELASCYYQSEEYENCLNAITEYESVSTRIFRKDFDYAQALPMAIISAKEVKNDAEYIEIADKYCSLVLDNTIDTDWALRYFVAQIYIDLYADTGKNTYLDKAYKIAFDNVNILVDEQHELNAAYISDIEEEKVDKNATKREKEEVKQYNKLLKEERKVALPPVSESLYLNCDLLFALADQRNISSTEQSRIESILHENDEKIFLTEALDNKFWFDKSNKEIDTNELTTTFDGDELSIPATCITAKSTVCVIVDGINGKITLDDWTVKKVERPKNADCSEYIATFSSQKGKDHKYHAGDTVSIIVVPVVESPEEMLEFIYDVVAVKKMFVLNGIKFERKLK